MKRLLSTSLSVSLATGIYGISFGALGVAAGLDIAVVMILSLLMFSGASQFAFVGVIAAGGSPIAAIASSWILGNRNGLYAMRLSPILKARGLKRLAAAQLTIDESNAVSAAQSEPRDQIAGFWATGIGVFIFWNLATLIGAIAGDFMGDPAVWGLDAAAAAAFLGLIWPKLKGRLPMAALAAAVALVLTPFLPAGGAILATALVALWPQGEKR
jgi:predicted branched-subunit amino acid permease